eukprot:6923007-Pyramimonas_sp.AAC.1
MISEKKDEHRRMDHPLMGTLYATFGTKATYYQFQNEITGKRQLFVNISDTQSADHATMCINLVQQSCRLSLDKAATLQLRAKLLEESTE